MCIDGTGRYKARGHVVAYRGFTLTASHSRTGALELRPYVHSSTMMFAPLAAGEWWQTPDNPRAHPDYGFHAHASLDRLTSDVGYGLLTHGNLEDLGARVRLGGPMMVHRVGGVVVGYRAKRMKLLSFLLPKGYKARYPELYKIVAIEARNRKVKIETYAHDEAGGLKR